MNSLALAPWAFLAGLLMFLAPCTLPIVPGYLAFIAGASEQKEEAASKRRRIIVNAFFFVVGFAVVFILFGTFAAFLGSLLGQWRYVLGRFAGAMLVFFGLVMLGLFRIPALEGQWHARIPKWLTLGVPQSSCLIGALFALGWSPCIGPILGSILFVASVQSTALQGALLLSIFSLGLGIPFMLAAFLMEQAGRVVGRLSAISFWLQMLGGVVLVVVGILMLGNWMGLLIGWGFGLFSGLGYEHLLNYL